MLRENLSIEVFHRRHLLSELDAVRRFVVLLASSTVSAHGSAPESYSHLTHRCQIS